MARRAAGLVEGSESATTLSIAPAPSRRASMSIPHRAADSSPTADNTLNRPPTPSGTISERYPSWSTTSRIVPLAASVVTTIRSRAFFSPSALISLSRTMRNCAEVSAVSPDLLTTLTRVRDQSRLTKPSTASQWTGSTLSSTNSRGPRRSPAGSRLYVDGFRAVCSAMLPSAEPPMPSTTRLSVESR